jgi:hypothetical protein
MEQVDNWSTSSDDLKRKHPPARGKPLYVSVRIATLSSLQNTGGGGCRGGAVVKVLRYKSEGH